MIQTLFTQRAVCWAQGLYLSEQLRSDRAGPELPAGRQIDREESDPAADTKQAIPGWGAASKPG